MENNNPDPFEIIEPGSVLYENMEKTYSVNHLKLEQYFPQVATQVEINYVPEFQLYQDNEFRYGILFKSSKGKDHFVFLTDYDTIQARQRQFAEVMAKYRHIFFLGTGIGEYLLLLADYMQGDWIVKENVVLPKIWIIEPEPIWFRTTLSFIDLQDLLSQPYLHFAVGQGWQNELEKQLVSNIRQDEPCLIIQNPTRNLDNYVKTIFHLFECVTHGGVDFLQRDRCRQVYEKKLADNITLVQGKLVPYELSQDQRKTYWKNLENLAKYEHFHCDGNVMLELKECEPCIVYKDKNIGIMVGGEKGGHLPLTADDDTTKEILTQFEAENSHYITYLVAGSGDGKVLRKVLDITNIANRWEGFAQVVYLIELHPIIFKVCLYFVDLENEIMSRRLRIFVGKNAVERFSHYIRDDSQARRPNKYFISNYYSATNLVQKIEEFLMSREQAEIFESKYLYQEIEKYYTGISYLQWKKRFTEYSKVKVMCITTRRSSFVQYCSRDLIEGFRENSCSCELIIEKDGLSSTTILEILKKLHAFKPDIVFLINHLRDEINYLPPNVPYFCWIQDPVYHIFENNALKINSYERVYAISSKWINELGGKDKYKNVQINFLPLGVNRKLYRPLKVSKKSYDVTYISHMSHPKELLALYSDSKERLYSAGEKEIFKNDGRLHYLLDQIYVLLAGKIAGLKIDGLNSLIDDRNRKLFLLDILKNFGLDDSSEIFKYLISFRSRLWKTIEAGLKYRAISELMTNGFRVGVWGINWDKYSGLQTIANGPAENGNDINEIQNNSHICLNNSMIISFHMKALEIMSSNSFMLTRKNEFDIESITDHFVEGDEIVLFRDENELVEKAGYYMDHPGEMKDISQRAYEKVLKMYTYKAISRKILRDFRTSFEKLC